MSKSVSSAMARKQDTQQAMATEQPRKNDPVGNLMRHMAPSIQAALPKHMDPDRFARIMITTIKSTPDLLKCLETSTGRTTLLGALMQCAQLGLDPGPLGHAYILPFNRRPREGQPYTEAVFVPGYKGLIDLARRSGHIVTIYANAIREHDEFTISYGVGGTLYHVPNWQESKARVTGYYAFAELKGGGHQFVVMSKSEVEEHRDRFSKASKYGPWVSDFDEMAKKTLIRRLVKILPMTSDYASAFATEERSVSLQSDGQMIDVEPADDHVQTISHQPSAPAQIEQIEAEEAPLQSYTRYGKWKEAANKIHGLASAAGINPDKVLAGVARSFGVPEIGNVPTNDLDQFASRLDELSTAPSSGEVPEHIAELMGLAADPN